MERCETCPHWGAKNLIMNTEELDGGRVKACALTVTVFDKPVPTDARAFASAESGDEAVLYTAAEFGCTEHPGNQDHCAHVQSSEKPLALCGARIQPFEFALVDAAHALACVEQDTRVQPCPACLKIINAS